MLLQLDPPIPLYIPHRDETVLAHLVIDYGIEHSLLWVTFSDIKGECWAYSNEEVRAQYNQTLQRCKST